MMALLRGKGSMAFMFKKATATSATSSSQGTVSAFPAPISQYIFPDGVFRGLASMEKETMVGSSYSGAYILKSQSKDARMRLLSLASFLTAAVLQAADTAQCCARSVVE